MLWTDYGPAGLSGSPGQQGSGMLCGMQAVAVCRMRCGMRLLVHVEQRWLLVPSAGIFHPKR